MIIQHQGKVRMMSQRQLSHPILYKHKAEVNKEAKPIF
jgi:hypothetical protein